MRALKKILALGSAILIGLMIIAAYLRLVPKNLIGAIVLAIVIIGFVYLILPLPNRLDTGKWPWQMDWKEFKMFLSRFW